MAVDGDERHPERQDGLRRQAEERLPQGSSGNQSPDARDVRSLLYELLIEHTELELQNAELQQAQLSLQKSHDRYQELYDFAPVAYFTLSRYNLITEVNIAGAILLGATKDSLFKTSFSGFVHPDSLDSFYYHHAQVFKSGDRRSCELKMLRRDESSFYALLESIAVPGAGGGPAQWRVAVTDIAAYKEVEAALAGSERFAFSLLNNSPNPDTSIRYVNPALERLTGFPPKELIGRKAPYPWWQAGNTEQAGRELEEAIRQGRTIAEHPFRKKNGDLFWVEVSSMAVSSQGRIQYAVLNWVDITQRKLAERELRIKDSAIASSINAIAITDLEGNLTYANPAFLSMWGVASEAELLGKNLVDFVAHRDETVKVWRTIEDKGTWMGEIAARRMDGSELDLLATASVVKDEMGIPTCFMASFIDITGRKHVEQAPLESQRRVQRLLESGIIGVTVHDTRGTILEANDAFLHMTGHIRDDLAAGHMNWQKMTPPEYMPLYEKALQELLDTGSCTPFEKEYYCKDGSRVPVLLGATLLDDGAPEPRWICFILDIAKRRQAEEEISRYRDHLEDLVQARTAELWLLNQELSREIAERKEMAKKLEDAVANFRNAIVSSADGIVIVDRDGIVRLVNPAAEAIFGRSAGEMVGSLFGFPVSPGKAELDIVRHGAVTATVEMRAVETSWEHGPAYLATIRDVTERKRIEGRVRALSHRIVQVQEEERRSLARELHDEISQSLALSLMLLDKSRDAPRLTLKPWLEKAQAVLAEVAEQVREMSRKLRPAILDDLGLLPALLWHVERYTSRTSIKVDFSYSGLDRDFSMDTRTAAYRIVQEALSNIARHSQATESRVQVQAGGNTLYIEVSDNGRGFDPARVGPTSTGITGMEERASLLGGSLSVHSAPGDGTRLVARLPLPRHIGEKPPGPEAP